jgi:hypothetical protein
MPKARAKKSARSKSKTPSLPSLKKKMEELHAVEKHLPHVFRTGTDISSLRTEPKVTGYIKKMKRALKGVTIVNIPRPPAKSLNKDRPLSSLVRNQVEHFKKMEEDLAPSERPVDAGAIRTEGQAAHYIKKVTAKLHGHRQVDIPRPDPGSINKNRPASQLLRAQVNHFRQLEGKPALDARSSPDASVVLTEAQAAAYIRDVTAKLKRRKSAKSKS